MSNQSLVTFSQEARARAMRLTDSACQGSNILLGLEECNRQTSELAGLEVRKGLVIEKYLGEGVSRAAYGTSHGTVIKVPKQANGARENIFESYLLSAMLPALRTTPIICRHRLFGMPILEVEYLDNLSCQPRDRKDAAGNQWNELALVARKGLGLADWLQIGFSKRFDRWVLNDVAPPWGALNQAEDANRLRYAYHKDVCDLSDHYQCKR